MISNKLFKKIEFLLSLVFFFSRQILWAEGVEANEKSHTGGPHMYVREVVNGCVWFVVCVALLEANNGWFVFFVFFAVLPSSLCSSSLFGSAVFIIFLDPCFFLCAPSLTVIGVIERRTGISIFFRCWFWMDVVTFRTTFCCRICMEFHFSCWIRQRVLFVRRDLWFWTGPFFVVKFKWLCALFRLPKSWDCSECRLYWLLLWF